MSTALWGSFGGHHWDCLDRTMWESRRIEIPGGCCTSLSRVKPGWSFVCLPCTSSWGAPGVKMEVSILTVKLTRIAWFSAISPSILNRFSPNFVKAIFYSNPNSPENFVKLYSVFQKLDHLTCNELKLLRPSISRILLHGKWSNFKYLNIILRIFYPC